MSASARQRSIVQQLLASTSPEEQLALRKGLRSEGYFPQIQRIYLNNPFFKLIDDEVAHFANRNDDDPLDGLILARDAASKTATPKIAVFCMPKSGSSFVTSALEAALELPAVSMTSVANGGASSRLGMNSREQELDELAVVKSILNSPQGFVAQVHTRCSLYLARQLRFYGITPILTVRNILDCIVSFDDMMLQWRRQERGKPGIHDTQFALPANYSELDDQTRYDILARSFGVWLIAFYLSWRRCVERRFVDPIVLRYEVDILDPAELVRKMASMTRMTDAQLERLSGYAANPDRVRARFSVGVKGRGARIDTGIVDDLIDYARKFAAELGDKEIAYLIR